MCMRPLTSSSLVHLMSGCSELRWAKSASAWSLWMAVSVSLPLLQQCNLHQRYDDEDEHDDNDNDEHNDNKMITMIVILMMSFR